MTCIHGLEEENCPTCRLIRFNVPDAPITPDITRRNVLKPDQSAYGKRSSMRHGLLKELDSKSRVSPLHLNQVDVHPKILNSLPDFKNRMFLERLKNIDLLKKDEHGISRKMELENPGWKFTEKD